jgi:4-hydroxy-tetrahydrodipicolinate synthase
MRQAFTGCGTALVTPFTRSGALDETGVRRLARRQIDAGIHFLVPCGTTGETPTLTDSERLRVVEIVVAEAKGAVPVLAGAGGYNTHEVIEAAQQMARAGADGILSVAPYYNKPTPEGFFRHFSAVADASPVPVVFYNVPGRTGSNIDVKTMLRLAEHPNIVGVKEASANLGQMMELLRDRPAGFQVVSGDDAFTLAMMAHGAEGVISVVANQIPGPMHDLVACAARGDFATALRIHNRFLDLMNLNFLESNPIPVKASLALMGLCAETFRLPLCPPKDSTREALRSELRRLDLLR